MLTLIVQAQDQEKLTYAEVNPRTYQLYLDQDWRALIREGRKALREGIDYYYLRMRMGIAHYELKHYQASIPHFEKAYAENPDNPSVQEYLYYAYLFSGRQMDAVFVARDFPDAMRQKLGIREQMSVHSLSAGYTGSLYETEDAIDGVLALDTAVGDGFQSIPKRFNLFGLTLNHNMGSSVNLTHSAQLLRKTNFVLSRFSGLNYTISDQTITQFQYYISPAIRAGKGLVIMPAFHFISYRIPGVVTSNGMGGRTTIAASSTHNDFILSLAVNKAFQYVNAGLSFSYGTLNNKKQYQAGAELTLYPFGNLNLYTTARVYKLFEYYGSDQMADRLILQNITGFKVFSWLWLEGEGSWGDYTDFTEYNGSVVYNSLDEINGRYAGRAIIWLKQGHLQFILSYNHTDLTNYYYPNIITEDFINTIHYSSNTFTGGIIWKL
ncbi:MAG: tetratricopeptide repeat protein [Bacteroidales bacterium]|nr:tetratricopeptide repeat protein [Bacteroidales bacterium]